MTYKETILKYYPDLLRYANRLYNDTNMAEDAVQDIYMKFFRQSAIQRYKDCSDKELKTLLFVSMRYGFYDYLQVSRLKRSLTKVEDYSWIKDDCRTDEALLIEDIMNCVDTIKNPLLKQTIYYRLRGYKYREIAEEMNTSLNNIRAYVFRVRQEKQLKTIMS